MPNEALGNNVREVRRERRLTQAELASAVGVSRQTVVAIEGGDYAPSVLLALRIAAALDHPIDDLFFIDPAHQEVRS
ncbi:MAG: helix-turn-helix domain-containing protein [Mobilicoccus sp.]|nr:helix-turn-helix domain-containing protein [Mobilicoccus sp.]